MPEQEFILAYDRFSDAIFRHCYFRVFDADLAKDLTQITFMKTWEYLAKGKQVDNFQYFLYHVATNLIIDNSRKKKAISLEDIQEKGFDRGMDSRGTLDEQIDTRAILELLAKVDEDAKELLVMRYIDDLSPKDI